MSVLPSALLEEICNKLQEKGSALVRSVAERLRQSLPHASVEEQIIQGFPKDVIVDFAKSWPADFIVVGSHGRRGMNRLWLGSVSQAVCSAAPCSVLVFRLQQEHACSSTDKSTVTTQI